ncbi:RluA family pseudouridine synthase, partial [Novosphingobium sp. 1949]
VPPGGEARPGAKAPRARRELSEEELELADQMVLTQDRAAIVLNKPPGLATQGGSGTKQHVDGLLDAYASDGPRPRLVHRLDKDTSGVLLIARTPGSAAYFSKRFSGRSAKKIYWALVIGVPSIEDGMIELPLAKQPGTGGEKMHVDEENGQSARTRYRVIDRAGNRAAWVELHPLTGRTHQLRVHMAAIGHPIVGDGKYGGQDAFLSGSISRKMHLHARRLIIEHPDGAPLDVTAPLPEHFANSMESLGFDEDDGAELAPSAPELTKADEKRAAKQHSKQMRKERRGERRSRGGEAVPARGGAKGKSGGKNFGDKPFGRSAAPKKSGPKKGKGSPVPAAKSRNGGGAPKGGGVSGPRPSAPRGKR